MAKTTFEPEELYEVILARPIRVGRTVISPSARGIKLKGKVVAENAADIIEATKVVE